LPDGGFSPADFIHAGHEDHPTRTALTRPRVANALDTLCDRLETYAQVGGFPGAVADFITHGQVQEPTVLEMWDVVRGDLNRYHQIRDATLPLKVLERLALNLASPISWQKLAGEASIDFKTVQTYVDLFSDAYLFLVVHRWDDGTPARKADKKIYPIDPLITRLAAAVNKRTRFDPDRPRLVESLLAVALFRATESEPIAAFGVPQSLMYYRTRAGREIDFLVGTDRNPYESKYSASADRRDAQVMHQSFGRGVLVTQRTLDLHGPVLLIPAALLLAMLQ
ncbi:MAG: DUF4143 domain-containing protein, partial [Chloroflexota bacterium]